MNKEGFFYFPFFYPYFNNSNIDELWKANDKKQEITYNSIGRHTEIAITNALHAIQFPKKCYVFSSNISTWKELRATINDSLRTEIKTGFNPFYRGNK